MEKTYKKIGKRYVEIAPSVPLNQEIVLSCAFRYALGRATYVVGSVCEELIRLEPLLGKNFKSRTVKEIQDYQDEHGKAGWEFDNDEWNYVKWFFTPERRFILEANFHNTNNWEEVEAFRSDELAEDGEYKYYSIDRKGSYYHTVRNIRSK